MWKSVLAFCHVGPRNRTQAVRLGSKHLYSLSHLTAPSPLFDLLLDTVLFCSQAGLYPWEILLSERWDHRLVPPCLTGAVFGRRALQEAWFCLLLPSSLPSFFLLDSRPSEFPEHS